MTLHHKMWELQNCTLVQELLPCTVGNMQKIHIYVYVSIYVYLCHYKFMYCNIWIYQLTIRLYIDSKSNYGRCYKTENIKTSIHFLSLSKQWAWYILSQGQFKIKLTGIRKLLKPTNKVHEFSGSFFSSAYVNGSKCCAVIRHINKTLFNPYGIWKTFAWVLMGFNRILRIKCSEADLLLGS